jgi:tetratricopeptide (TPR) repeat protein
MRSPSWLRLALVLQLLMMILSGTALAQPEESRWTALVDRGNARYRSRHFQEALEAYQAALELRSQPILLFNVGQCYRQLGRYREALIFYQRYLVLAPSAANRATVERFIFELRAALPRAERDAVPPTTTPPPTSLGPPPAQAGVSQSAQLAVRPPATEPAVTTAPVTARADVEPTVRPWYRRWYVWTIIGAAVAGGVVAAVVTTQPSTPGSALGPMTFRFPGGGH